MTTVSRWERLAWILSGFMAALIALTMCGCYTPQPKANAGSASFKSVVEPAVAVTEKDINEIMEGADGSRTIRNIGERTTAPAMRATVESKSQGPTVEGPGAERAKLGAPEASPEGAKAGATDVSWRKVLPPGKEWLLLVIGGALLAGGAALTWKAPAWGAPVLAAGAGCIGFYYYPWAALGGAAVWVGVGVWQDRQAKKAKERAAVAESAVSTVATAIEQTDARTKGAVKSAVAKKMAGKTKEADLIVKVKKA